VRHDKNDIMQLVKEKDEKILTYQKQVKEKDDEMKNKQHQMKEKDEEMSECKKHKREMEDELLTIACLSSLDELKLVLKKNKDLRESEEVEVEDLKEDLVTEQRVEEVQKKKIATRKSTETCQENLSMSELISFKSLSSTPGTSKSARYRARKRLRAQSNVHDDCVVSAEYSCSADNMM